MLSLSRLKNVITINNMILALYELNRTEPYCCYESLQKKRLSDKTPKNMILFYKIKIKL